MMMMSCLFILFCLRTGTPSSAPSVGSEQLGELACSAVHPAWPSLRLLLPSPLPLCFLLCLMRCIIMYVVWCYLNFVLLLSLPLPSSLQWPALRRTVRARRPASFPRFSIITIRRRRRILILIAVIIVIVSNTNNSNSSNSSDTNNNHMGTKLCPVSFPRFSHIEWAESSTTPSWARARRLSRAAKGGIYVFLVACCLCMLCVLFIFLCFCAAKRGMRWTLAAMAWRTRASLVCAGALNTDSSPGFLRSTEGGRTMRRLSKSQQSIADTYCACYVVIDTSPMAGKLLMMCVYIYIYICICRERERARSIRFLAVLPGEEVVVAASEVALAVVALNLDDLANKYVRQSALAPPTGVLVRHWWAHVPHWCQLQQLPCHTLLAQTLDCAWEQQASEQRC